jgi:DNA repair exonuclease SbcCD ATPase subunit
LLRRLGETKEGYRSARKNVRAARRALILIQTAAVKVHTTIKSELERVVTFALRDVFQKDGYDLEVELKTTKRALSATFWFVDNKGRKIDPLEGAGYGCVDVACFAIRVASMVMCGKSRTLWLDEPFRNVSEEYRHRLVRMVQHLTKELKVQIVMSTHMKELINGADKHFLIGAERDVQ